ncbi:MAG: tetratricopeptide (TPR) repeat protein [Planctomycetaceae bacterium]|jgi:tetratricopeptide (TPR) repeat protein
MNPGPEVISAAQREFETLWRAGDSPPHPGEFLKRYASESLDVRRVIAQEVVRVDLSERWDRWRQHNARVASGTSVPPAPILSDYIKLCPDLGTLNSIPPALVEFEFRTRSTSGDSVSVDDYCTLYPHATSVFEATLNSRETKIAGHDQTIIEDPTLPIPTNRPGELPDKFNNYEVIRELGRGAMGVVYLARHTVLESQIAIKAILTDKFPSKREVELFLNEARIAGNLRHENIVRVLEAGEYEGHYFIAMEFVPGGGLDERIREHPLDAIVAARLTKTTAEAMHYAHTQPEPVFHRDIKPANILVTEDDIPYVCDFGIAKRVSTNREAKDSVVGTPSYMPPEQARGQAVDARSDVYSLGAMLYTLIVGRPPFAAGNIMQTLQQVKELDPVAPSELDPSVSRDLEAICLKCLSKSPENRYQTAQLLADDLDNFLNDRPIVARPPSSLARFDKWKRRNPAMARMVLLVFTLLTATAVSAVCAAVVLRSLQVQAVDAEHEARTARDEAVAAKDVANKAKDDAEAAEDIARKAKDDAETAEGVAEVNEAKAKKAEELALENEEKAKSAEKAAVNAKNAAINAKKEEEKQRMLAEMQKQEAEKQKGIAENQKIVAEGNLNVANDAIDVLIMKLADKGLDDIPGMQPLRRDIVKAAGEMLQKLATLPENASPEMQIKTAKANLRLGLIYKLVGEKQDARQKFQAAHDTVEPLGGSVSATSALIQSLRGLAEVAEQIDDEELQLLQASKLARQLAKDYPQDSNAIQEAALTLNSYGVCLAGLKDAEDAIKQFEDSQQFYQQLLIFLKDTERKFEQEQKIEWPRRYAESLNNRSVQILTRGTEEHIQEAISLHVRAFEIQLSLLEGKEIPPQLQPVRQNAAALRSQVMEGVNQYAAALGQREEQRSRVVMNDLAQTVINMANSCSMMGNSIPETRDLDAKAWYGLALSVSDQAIAGYSRLADDFPSIPDYRLRQSHAVKIRVSAKDSLNYWTRDDVKPLIKTADEQIQNCRSLAVRFPTRSRDFDDLRSEWTRIRNEIARGQ